MIRIQEIDDKLLATEDKKMEKKLSEMTLEELWALFPIKFTEHNSEWKKQYRVHQKTYNGCKKAI